MSKTKEWIISEIRSLQNRIYNAEADLERVCLAEDEEELYDAIQRCSDEISELKRDLEKLTDPEERKFEEEWCRERAMEAGMLHGIDAYNDEMGY